MSNVIHQENTCLLKSLSSVQTLSATIDHCISKDMVHNGAFSLTLWSREVAENTTPFAPSFAFSHWPHQGGKGWQPFPHLCYAPLHLQRQCDVMGKWCALTEVVLSTGAPTCKKFMETQNNLFLVSLIKFNRTFKNKHPFLKDNSATYLS